MTKEEFYDKNISPLISKIIKLCKESDINAFCTFVLDDNGDGNGPMCCMTSLPIDKTCKGYDMINRLYKEVKSRPAFAAFTIISTPKK